MAENISKSLATDNYDNVLLTLTLYLLKCRIESLVILTPTSRKNHNFILCFELFNKYFVVV